MSDNQLYCASLNGKPYERPCSKVVCIGRNYAEHAKELNNPVPDRPILFIKPESTIQADSVLTIPRDGIHYETELALLIGRELKMPSDVEPAAIAGLGLGLDLTDRSLQAELKENGHPWERAKSFNGATWLSGFLPYELEALDQIRFGMQLNGESKQEGHTKSMLFPVMALLSEIVANFALRAGDIVLTGTPKGVGQLHDGDRISLSLDIGDLQLPAHQLEVSVIG